MFLYFGDDLKSISMYKIMFNWSDKSANKPFLLSSKRLQHGYRDELNKRICLPVAHVAVVGEQSE